MNVASLDNSKRLWELSGWDDTDLGYRKDDSGIDKGDTYRIENGYDIPAYDSGYLLRKLHQCHITLTNIWSAGQWKAQGSANGELYKKAYREFADTPEDALALLAIKLFEEAVL